MLKILNDYCKIFTTTKPWEKKLRHNKMQEWKRKPYDLLPDYQELREFLAYADNQDIVSISYPFQEKVIFPICDHEIFDKHNIDAMKLIIFNFSGTGFLEYKKDYSLNLIEFALKHAPDDQELLRVKLDSETRYYDYTIHEIPRGVLYDQNGASIEQTQENLEGLEDYGNLCAKLGEDRNALIKDCRFYYKLWIEYLSSNHEKYENFEDCINKHRTAQKS